MNLDPTPTVWVDAELIGQHVHIKLATGGQYGMPDKPLPIPEQRAGASQDAGEAGTMIFRERDWLPFIQALARGGHLTGLRVIWWLRPHDQRWQWNGHPEYPCIVGETDPVEWEPPADRDDPPYPVSRRA